MTLRLGHWEIGTPNGIYDFFVPRRGQMRVECVTAHDGRRVTFRGFYTFRAFVVHCLTAPFVPFREALRMPQFARAGALTFDAATANNSASGDHSFSHTCTGQNMLLTLAYCAMSETADTVTYNSAALTSKVAVGPNNSRTDSIHYKVNPTTGANTLAVTKSGTTAESSCAAISFSGADTALQNGATATKDNVAGAQDISVTTTRAQSFVIAAFTSNVDPSTADADQTNVVLTGSSPYKKAAYKAAPNITSASIGYTTDGTARAHVIAEFWSPAGSGGGKAGLTTLRVG